MKNATIELISKLNDIYTTYESYCWRYDNCKIVILFVDNCICLYISEDDYSRDEFVLSFEKKENRIYQYVALNFFEMVLGDVFIYKEGNTFYNEKHKSYVNIVINDDKLLELINQLVFNQEEVFIQEGINEIYKKKPFKLYNKKFFNDLDKRIDVSKKLLRGNKR